MAPAERLTVDGGLGSLRAALDSTVLNVRHARKASFAQEDSDQCYLCAGP